MKLKLISAVCLVLCVLGILGCVVGVCVGLAAPNIAGKLVITAFYMLCIVRGVSLCHDILGELLN